MRLLRLKVRVVTDCRRQRSGLTDRLAGWFCAACLRVCCGSLPRYVVIIVKSCEKMIDADKIGAVLQCLTWVYPACKVRTGNKLGVREYGRLPGYHTPLSPTTMTRSARVVLLVI